ncbi:DUF6396 domain-containing protein [Pseudomonas sp. NPDC007930]|uniref:SEL1-like repeat protein n=1 Tax=Pseudomonas sp. NPDC007930 TaxID=3364417 RepID=UPI0036EE2D03
MITLPRVKMFQRCIAASLFCVAALASASAKTGVAQDSTVMPEHSLDFTCQHEIFHTMSTEVDSMFLYGRWLQQNNLLARDGLVNRQVERFYRIAAEHGHSKASINLQNGVFRGEFSAQPGDSLRLSERLIEAEVASGYYFFGKMLRSGTGGLEQDSEMALRYFRKAADLGSAEAQFLIAEILSPRTIAPAVAAQMYLCSAQQGHGEAGMTLGVFYMAGGEYEKAMHAFQLGVSGGDSIAASFLEEGFRERHEPDSINYIGQDIDIERAARYEAIGDRLYGWSYANPSVPEIDEIVPLPPAKLPEWDGTLKWVKARKANIAPTKPSEDLIQRLAREKGLDPTTGKPIPG